MASPKKSLLNPLMKSRARLDETTMRALFEADPKRFTQFSAKAGDILLDYSKNRIDKQAMANLMALARAVKVDRSRCHPVVSSRLPGHPTGRD